jgi:hypothetical protein
MVEDYFFNPKMDPRFLSVKAGPERPLFLNFRFLVGLRLTLLAN